MRSGAGRRTLPDVNKHGAAVKQMNIAEWNAFLSGLYERNDRLELRQPGGTYTPDEDVDAYVFSGHAEAMQSVDVDGDVWGTLEDIEESATSEDEAWHKILSFYTERGCLLIQITDADEREEWLVTEDLARRLKLWPSS